MDFSERFIDNREQGETRHRQCQLVMLRMLKILDYLCEKHGIKYFLTGGSLLGAIRHKGFIPWDDDLDLGMTRENYEKFVRLAVAELPTDVFFQNPDTDTHYPENSNVDARLRDKYSSYNHIDGVNNKWHEGLQIDIFVYDKAFIPSNFIIICQNAFLKWATNSKGRANVLKLISKFPLLLVYASNYLQYFGMRKFGDNYIKKKEIATLVKAKFEDMEFFIPQGWHNCLKRQYGDYMKLPPLEKQQSDHNVLPDPFTPCMHQEILQWKERSSLAGK